MNTYMTIITQKIIGIGVLASLILFPLLASAETGVTATVGADASVQGAGVSTGVTANATVTAALTRGKEKGDKELDRRVANLNDLSAKAEGLKNLSPADKASISTTLSNQINALTALKAKIDADTDAATLKTDIQSITGSYRIFALVMPQVRIIIAADRIVTIAGEMQLFSAKLQARISAAASAGADMTAATALLADYNAKIADAQVRAQAAVTAIATLAPDQGDKTKLAANTKALQDARAKAVLAQKDLIAARQDAQKIVLVVKGKASVNATASTTSNQ